MPQTQLVNQQINLFQPIFRKERKLLSFEALIQICAVMVIALILLTGYGWWQSKGLDAQVAQLKKQHDARLEMLQQVTSEASKQSSNDETQKEIAQLQAELDAERYILSVLGEDEFGQTTGFSEYLQIFMRRVVQGMWITRFTVFDSGDNMLIQGGSLSADLIPEFLQGLSQEVQLQGMHFSVLQMARKEPNKAWIEFNLSSKEIEESLLE